MLQRNSAAGRTFRNQEVAPLLRYSGCNGRCRSTRFDGICKRAISQTELVGIEMKASILSFRAAVLVVIAGMIWGIVMGISQDHSTMPAHAHLNLLGWVSLFLFGIYYHLHPAVDLSRLALVQVWIWIVGTIVHRAKSSSCGNRPRPDYSGSAAWPG